jgi:hypothetical protein
MVIGITSQPFRYPEYLVKISQVNRSSGQVAFAFAFAFASRGDSAAR